MKKKLLAFGIVILFVLVGTVPAISQNFDKSLSSTLLDNFSKNKEVNLVTIPIYKYPFSGKVPSMHPIDDMNRWIVEDRVTSDGSSTGDNGKSVIYDKYDDAFYVFYNDESNCDEYTSICVNKLWLDNDTWSGKFQFKNNVYVCGENWNNNQYYEQHITISAILDKFNHIWVVWGGHANANYPICCFRSKYPIDSPQFNYKSVNNWELPVTIEPTIDSSSPRIHVSKNNTYLIFMRYAGIEYPPIPSYIKVYWSFDNGSTWNNRTISQEFYGNTLWFYDEDNDTDKLFMYAAEAKFSSSCWYDSGNHFFWTTATDIINNNGAYASNQTASDKPLYDFPITDDEIINIDFITEPMSRDPHGIAFDTTNDYIYISYKRKASNERYGVGFLDKKLGTDDEWTITVVEPFNNLAYIENLRYIDDELYLLAGFDVGSNRYMIRYANSSTPHKIDSWKWINLSENKFSIEENSVHRAFTKSVLIPFYDAGILAFLLKYDKHYISTANGDKRNQYGATYDWIAVKYIFVREDVNAPNKPVIDGPEVGKSGNEYEFGVTSIDPNGDDVLYLIDWGDGTSTDWIGPYSSGHSGKVSHKYSDVGEYYITAKAKDINGNRSWWSDPYVFNIVYPVIEIGDITGGLFKINVVVKNIGLVEIENASWSISLDGGFIILGGYTPGIIENIPVDGEVSIKSNFILGFGQTMIVVEAEEPPATSDSKDQIARLFLFFIKI